LHSLVCHHSQRKQNHSTFFLRNRAELELICRLVKEMPAGAELRLCVLACSKGAEVYSILWALRSAHPDLRIRTSASDISEEILAFAREGVYSRNGPAGLDAASGPDAAKTSAATWKDQPVSIFERMTAAEMEAMFDLDGCEAKVKPRLKEGITWIAGDASRPEFVAALGQQDVVVANRFLCHMDAAAAENCLRNIVRLVRPGGFLFVSGVDLEVRTKLALELGWRPIDRLMRELHEGDTSLHGGWPLEWWGLEPFSHDDPNWRVRYAAVFQIGG
jgi:chemotaxis methyl-accepting protein methylase